MHRLALVAVLFASACTSELPTSSETEAASVCAAGATVRGVDVSYYQGTIDWSAVKGDGIDFAFIRVSDGSGYLDSKFDANWSGARAAGVLRGAYQFFRPEEDAIAQADVLLSHMGTLESDDLPPVLDVEVADGVAAGDVAAGVNAWVAHVAAATGRAPVIYTGRYFWQDSVGGDAPAGSPLWVANWGVSCPSIPAQWSDWTFWQDADDGTVAGISGGVDTDSFNGDLGALGGLGGPAVPCGMIDAAGGTIDDGDACFRSGGPSQYLRDVSDGGEDGDLIWTHTTDDASEANFAEWTLELAEAGRYRVEVYTAAGFAQSKQADYRLRHAGVDVDVTIDQSAVDGWQSLGDFDFAAGGDQTIHLGDDTGEASAGNVQLAFDAIRLTRIDGSSQSGDDDAGSGGASGGCSIAGGGGAGGAAVVVLCVGFVVFGNARARRRVRCRRVARGTRDA